uniref:Pyruvate kinase n=1 Tax=Paratrimastix pyriformis TaxID=342808 RepID=A0SNX5_9EUKA|nr:pyruvate kinase [Paratrimastix pyriformis]
MSCLTKIVCTIGPASCSVEVLKKLIAAGMNVARLNFSHGNYDLMREWFRNVRTAAAELNKEIAVMADLQGPKIRCNGFPGGSIELKHNAEVIIAFSAEDGAPATATSPAIITTKFQPLAERAKPGEHILFDDGYLEVVVERTAADGVHCRVVVPGVLKPRKGINLPQTDLGPLPALTAKDTEDARFVLRELDIDFLSLSFVRRPEDIQDLRRIIQEYGKDVKIISKIEKPQAIERLSDIVAASDGIMVARGDLGVEVGNHKVPGLQKRMIREAIARGIPVITATQMLESMINNPRPTRAEASDVANAVWDGTDAVMLSAETAAGNFPVEAVTMMRQILVDAEAQPPSAFSSQLADITRGLGQVQLDSSGTEIGMSMGRTAVELAKLTHSAAIACVTDTGNAAVRVSTCRPAIPIFSFTTSLTTVRRLALVRGCFPILMSRIPEAEMAFIELERVLTERGCVHEGDRVVYTAGLPTLKRATTNTVHIRRVGGGL